MVWIDYSIIILYLVVVIGFGFWYQKKASQNLQSYFLGGNRFHWLALAMSGSVSTFDITGTMWIVSLLFIMGMKSMWVHWMWGFMIGAFCLAFMGKWVRRSNVMTGAEWMVTRFGDGGAGKSARTVYALMAVITQFGLLKPLVQWLGEKKLLLLGCAALGLGMFGVGLVETVILAIVFFAPFAFGQGVTQPSLQSLITRFGTRGTGGRMLGLYQASRSLALILSPVWAGYAFEQLGPRSVYFIGAIILVVATVLVLSLLRINSQVSTSQPVSEEQ